MDLRSVLVLLGLAFVANSQRLPQVEIDTGVVEGRRIATHYVRGDPANNETIFVNSFYGIPYGAPPVGDLRFAKPEPAEPWDDVFEAKGLPTSCMQNTGGLLWLTHPGYRNVDEDCLNLNVFTPEDMSESYPVMVWFYGGGFMAGSSIQYPGHFLAARDVVVVVVNYRVGIFGFVNTGDDVAPGNYGLWDQHLALQWVQRNVAQFGGDPTKVTLFGQSAGGASSSLHITSPHARDLFNQVIAESGTELNFWSLNYPNSDPRNYTKQVAAKLDCPEEPSEDMIACLRTIEQYTLRNNSNVRCPPGHFCQGHAPVVDGEGGYIPDYPQYLRNNGDFKKDINIMTGYLSDDGSFYTVAYIPEAWDGGFNRSEFQRILKENLLEIWAPQFPPQMQEDGYGAIDFMYTPWPYLEDKELNRDSFNQMITDAAFGYLTDKQLRYQAPEGGNHYKYNYGWRPEATTEGEGFWNNTEWAGVPHAAELPFVFGWALMKLAPQVRADSRILVDILDYREEDFAIADFMMDLWTNFAKFGNPTPEPMDKPLGGGSVSWDEWTLDNYNTFIINNDDAKNVPDYRADYNAFIEQYMSYIIDKPLFGEMNALQEVKEEGILDSDIIFEAEFNFVKKLLTTRFPGKFDHLYEDEEWLE